MSNAILFTQELLHDLGFASEIFAGERDPRIERPVHPLAELPASPDDLLLVHHSLGHEHLDWLLGLPQRKVLVYHNVTPATFFADDPSLCQRTELGRAQLEHLRDHVIASIADSPFNARELADLAYRDVTILPLLLDTARLAHAPWNASIVDTHAGRHTTLFVGRVQRSKGIHDLVEVFRHVRAWMPDPAQLVLVGSHDPRARYVLELRELVARHGLTDDVHLLGHLPDADLLGWYRTANVFVSMSEHEGFGVPLVEAMTFGVPVVAHASTSVPATLGDAGILVTGKPHAEVAALVCLLAEDRALRRRVTARQRTRARTFEADALRPQLAEFLARFGIPVAVGVRAPAEPAIPVDIQVEGSIESSYSLAIVNRELARALEADAPGTVAMLASDGYGDYAPDRAALAAMPEVERLWLRGRKGSMAPVVLRNMYPPRLADMDGAVNLVNFFWEESALPAAWIDAFNRHLDAVCVASRYVKKVLIDAGVHVPVHVIGAGVEHVLRQSPVDTTLALGRGFRFLHVSSAFPRKGVDVLLRAYAAAFTDADDVTLVVKTFPNPHNETARQIEELRRATPRCPDVLHVDQDLPAAELFDLYRRCHAFVAPTRGEGFGLPMAEATLCGLPVVTTAYGGHRDFSPDEACWPIPFTFARTQSHFGLFDSVWADPDPDALAQALRAVFEATPEERTAVVARARAILDERCTWARAAANVRQVIHDVRATRPLAAVPIRVGWATTWNSKCGVARYSRFLVDHLPPGSVDLTVLASRCDTLVAADEPNVRRCWNDVYSPDLSDLRAVVAAEALEAVVVQFNFGLFGVDALGDLLADCARRGIVTVVAFHATRDGGQDLLGRIRPALAAADRLLVHSVDDLNRLKGFGLVDNVTLFPQGVVPHVPDDPARLRARLGLPADGPVIGSYGFLLPHKGVDKLIEAFPEILRAHPDATLLLVNALYSTPESAATRAQCCALIDRLGIAAHVRLITDFLEDDESLCLLESADVVVYPYQGTEESSSAAVRFGLASGRPVACSPLRIFDDVAEVVHFLPGSTPAEIATGLRRVLADPALRASRSERQQEWLRSHAWPVLARRFAGMVRALVRERRGAEARAGTTENDEPPREEPHVDHHRSGTQRG